MSPNSSLDEKNIDIKTAINQKTFSVGHLYEIIYIIMKNTAETDGPYMQQYGAKNICDLHAG